jgi:uncharacterized OB-fold protein
MIIKSRTEPQYIEKINMYKIGIILEDEDGRLDGGSVYNINDKYFNQFTIGAEVEATFKKNKVGNTVNISLIKEKSSQLNTKDTYLCDEDDGFQF